jgi:hypothetical protein
LLAECNKTEGAKRLLPLKVKVVWAFTFSGSSRSRSRFLSGKIRRRIARLRAVL